jgi:hypothetical protein
VSDQQNPPRPVDVPISRDEQRQNCIVDRRSGFDRRRVYSLVYFAKGGIERRSGRDRRKINERRQLWEKHEMPCSGTPG